MLIVFCLSQGDRKQQQNFAALALHAEGEAQRPMLSPGGGEGLATAGWAYRNCCRKWAGIAWECAAVMEGQGLRAALQVPKQMLAVTGRAPLFKYGWVSCNAAEGDLWQGLMEFQLLLS